MKCKVHLSVNSNTYCKRGGIYPQWSTDYSQVNCKCCRRKVLKSIKSGTGFIYIDRSSSISDQEIEAFKTEMSKVLTRG